MFMFYLLMQEPESAFSVNLEFCKYILANFLNGKAIFDGVRKHKTIDANGDEKEQLVFALFVHVFLLLFRCRIRLFQIPASCGGQTSLSAGCCLKTKKRCV